ncbi:Siah3 [Columba livia]|nr:Siah3 [Columba livia]
MITSKMKRATRGNEMFLSPHADAVSVEAKCPTCQQNPIATIHWIRAQAVRSGWRCHRCLLTIQRSMYPGLDLSLSVLLGVDEKTHFPQSPANLNRMQTQRRQQELLVKDEGTIRKQIRSQLNLQKLHKATGDNLVLQLSTVFLVSCILTHPAGFPIQEQAESILQAEHHLLQAPEAALVISHRYAPPRCAAVQTSAEQGVLPPCHHHEVVHDPQLVPCMCPLFSCPWEGHLEVVVSHLRQTHHINILQGAEIVFLATDMHLPAPTDWIIMHSCLGHQFLLVLRKQEKYEGHPQFFATMMLIGTPTQADNFTYRLELNRNQRRLKWEATPRSVLERVDSVISDGDCLVLNTSLAQLFSDNGSLAIGIAITTSKVHNTEAEM